MSTKMVKLDDLEETEVTADETVYFGLDGTSYEIDLSSKNAAKLRNSLAPFKAAARKVHTDRRRITAKPSVPSASQDQNTAIREWARSKGHKVSHKGRIPEAIVDAFNAEHAPKGHPVRELVFSGA